MCIYSQDLKSCASCAYWGGPRRAHKGNYGTESNRYTTGPCAHVKRRGVVCSENAFCQDYRKWSAIDDKTVAIITG